VIALLALGCDILEDLPKPDGGPAGSGALETEVLALKTKGGGIVSVPIDVDEETTALLVTGAADKFVSLERITDPEGSAVLEWQDWYYTPYSLTYAIFGFDRATAANWPIRSIDAPLTPGVWTFELATIDASGYYVGNTPIDVTVHRKADADFSGGTVKVQITWADGVDQDSDIVDGVARAVEHWREVWAAAGLTLVESYATSTLDPQLGFAIKGTDDLIPVASVKDPESLLMVIGDEIQGEPYTFGIAGGIPGSVAPTRMTYVVVSWLAHAGANGKLSNEEASLMGETMAHEAGHFMGLFHPAELSYYDYYLFDAWDALDDTPECSDSATCDALLGNNNMYAYPLCDYYGDGGCESQDQYTVDQAAVLNRYTPVL
jgi:hypothetical protein